MHAISLSQGAVLETGCVYVAPLLEGLALPGGLCAATNPKSSTGPARCVHARHRRRRLRLRSNSGRLSGPLYAEICPQTFPVVVRKGSRLSQIRFRAGGPDAKPVQDIPLSVDLAGDQDGLVGYRAKRHTGLVDVDAVGACAMLDYWEPIYVRGKKRLILDPDQFYILASKEAVHVPPTQAAEMVPFNPLVGEFRVHYAGFFDPGFGHAEAGGTGSKAVLEVRSHNVPFVLEDGQIDRPPGVRAAHRHAGAALRPRPCLALPGAGPQALQAFQVTFRASVIPTSAAQPRDSSPRTQELSLRSTIGL